MHPHHGGWDRGAVAIEFALIATLLLTIVVATFEGGRVWMVQSTLSQAAREGARTMAVSNDPVRAEEVIEARASAAGVEASGSVDLADCPVGGEVTATATVTVTSLTGLLDPLFGGSGLPLTGKAVMRCGG